MRASDLKPRALSAVIPISGADAAAEAHELRAFLVGHAAAVAAAWEAYEEARELCLPKEYGLYTVGKADYWRYPPVEAAARVLCEVEDSEMAYWAQARLIDVERRLGEGPSGPQMVWTLGYAAA